MSDITTAPPAGASEQPNASDTSPISESAAAGLLAEWDREDDTADESVADEPASNNTEDNPSDDSPVDEADEPIEETAETTEEADKEPVEETETEDKPEPEEFVHGNARTRLRDGTVVPVSELKKGYDELRELRAKVPDLTAAEQQLQARHAQIAQREQFVQQVLPQALQLLQAHIPPEPDPELADENSPKYDPIAHYQQSIRHQQGMARLGEMQAAYQAQIAQQQKQAEEARAATYQQTVREEQRKLVEKIPDIANPEKGKAIFDGFVKTAEQYGFTRGDITNVTDHRVFYMVHELASKAAAYDKLMSQKPVVTQKAKTSVPVQNPGRRVPAQGQATQAQNELIQRARKTGRFNDAAAALATFD